MTRSTRLLLCCALLFTFIIGCSNQQQAPEQPAKKEEAKTEKAPAKEEKKEEAGPPWKLAPTAVPGKVGDTVFSVAPIGKKWNIVGFKLGTLEAVDGNTAKLKKNSLSTLDKVPGALITPVPQNETYKAGDVVFGDVYATARVARVVKVDGQTVETKTEWVNKVKPIKMTAGKNVRKQPVGMEPMALVAYPNMGGTYLGTLAVVQGDKAWVIAQSGHMKEVKKDQVTPLDPTPVYKQGDDVFATWGGGKFFPAKISKVIDGGLMYEVSYISDNPALKKPGTKAFWEVTKTALKLK